MIWSFDEPERVATCGIIFAMKRLLDYRGDNNAIFPVNTRYLWGIRNDWNVQSQITRPSGDCWRHALSTLPLLCQGCRG